MQVRERGGPVDAPDVAADGTLRSDPAALPRRARSLVAEWTSVFLGSLFLGVFFTWPLALHPTSGVYGFGNDKFGGIWHSQWIHRTALGQGDQSFTHELQYPFGAVFDERFVQPFDRLLAVFLGGIGDGIFVTNLQTLLSFAIAGPAMYALALYLTRSRAAAALAAVIFAASPFHLGMAMQYPSLATIQCAPLVVLASLVTVREQRLRDAAFLGAMLAVTWLSSYYYGWFAFLFLGVALLVAALRAVIAATLARRLVAAVAGGVRFVLTRGGVAAATFVLLTAPFLLPLALKVQGDPSTYSRTAEDLHLNAVKPWQYVLPPHDNPVLGRFTSDFILSHTGILPVYEQSLYLGVVPALLAVVALVGVRRARPEARYAAPLLVASALFMVLLSLGAALPVKPFSVRAWMDPASVGYVQNVSVPLFELVPIFRYYGRTFIFTSVSLAALAAIGFRVVEPSLRRRLSIAPVGAAAALIAAVLFEFNNIPPTRWTELPREPWMHVLDRTPRDAPVVNYPEAGFYSPRSYYYIVTQAQHGHPTLNYAATPEAKELSFAVADPNSPEAGRRLSEAGFEYAVVHTDLPPATMPPYQPALPDDSLDPNDGAANPWFEHFATVRNAVVYRIRERPRPSGRFVSASYGMGFNDEETDGATRWRWAWGEAASLSLQVSGPPRWFTLSFDVSSFHEPRRLEVFLNGRPVHRLDVPHDVLRDVAIPLVLGEGAHDVVLRFAPGAVVVNDVLHNGDERHVSVRVSPPVIEESSVGAVAQFGRGFWQRESAEGPDWRWIAGDRGELTVSVRGQRQRLALAFEATSLGTPRRLAISVEGRVVETVLVPADVRREIVVPLELGPGTHTVVLAATPGAVPAGTVLGNADTRELSVRVEAPDLRPMRAGTLAVLGNGFLPDGHADGRRPQWMTSQSAGVEVHVRGGNGNLELLLDARALAEAGALQVRANGERLVRARIPADRFRRVVVPLELPPGSHRLTLRTSATPVAIDGEHSATLQVAPPVLQRRSSGAFLQGGASEPAAVRFGDGFGGEEVEGADTWRWLTGDEGTITLVANTGERKRLVLAFAAMSLGDVRRLEVSVDGERAASVVVPPGKPKEFRVPVDVAGGRHEMRFAVTPSARAIDEVVGGDDPRAEGIRVRTPTVELERPTIGSSFAGGAYGYGFARPTPDDPPGWRWLSGEKGNLLVTTTGRKRPLRVSFRAQSFDDRPRRLTVTVGDKTVTSRIVPTDRPVRLIVPLDGGPGVHAIHLESDPGSVFHGERVFHPDPRKVSIRVEMPKIEGLARG